MYDRCALTLIGMSVLAGCADDASVDVGTDAEVTTQSSVTTPLVTTTPDVEPRAPTVGELLISQLYTSGAPPAGGTDHYYSDQFIEITNNVDVPLDLAGVMWCWTSMRPTRSWGSS